MSYDYNRIITSDKLKAEIIAGLPDSGFNRIDTNDGDDIFIFFDQVLTAEQKTTLDTIVTNHVVFVPASPTDLVALRTQINTIITNNPAKAAPFNANLRLVLLDMFDEPTLKKILAAIQ